MRLLKSSMLRYHLLILLIVPLIVSAQELNCRVVVNADQVQTTERSIFQEMEVVFAEFMNNRRWTEDQYEQEERINCNLILTISQQPSIGRFEASYQLPESNSLPEEIAQDQPK